MTRVIELGSRFRGLLAVLACSLAISSCASFEQHNTRANSGAVTLDESYVVMRQGENAAAPENGSITGGESDAEQGGFVVLESLPAGGEVSFENIEFGKSLSVDPSIDLKVDRMPIADFIHYALGELLGIEYVIDSSVKGNEPITMASSGLQSPQRVYNTVLRTLASKGLEIRVDDDVHFLFRKDPRKKQGGNVIIKIGRDADAVPNVTGEILQVVPLKYGANISLERTLKDLLEIEVSLDTTQNALFLRGLRTEIIKALRFVEMFDAPANRGRFIGIIELVYLTSEDFNRQVSELLRAEGIPAGSSGASSETVVIVPLPNIGSSAIFANSQELLDRVQYWATIIDKPAAGANEQYFVFYPQFARAEEIGSSLQQLLGAAANSSLGASPQRSVQRGVESTGQAPNASRASSFSNDKLRMVVVERSNSLVFYTSGTEYQGLLPLLEQLDVLPKQVLLDIVIAEVSLKDEFKFGFEWALQQSEVTLSTLGAFGASRIGGTALALTGSDGELISQVLQTSQLINVLSNPTMLVRDGVTANINVGSDISVVGATTFDPINGQRQTTATTYRKTGVDVTVTPTINAEGVVLMNVQQRISNAVPNSTGAGGNPDVFERSISTEVVAASGQTVLLGGLISEDVTASGSGTPGISKVPALGWLFKSEADSGSRTELVMMITARVVDDLSAWEELERKFDDGLRYLDLAQ